MIQYKAFDSQNTLALLSLSGFDEVRLADDMSVSFRFNGETYEISRFDGKISIGLVRDVYSLEEIYVGMKAGVELMRVNPSVQIYYSHPDHKIRIRLWMDCATTVDFEKAVFRGIDELEQLANDFQSRLQRHLFERVASAFYSILHK